MKRLASWATALALALSGCGRTTGDCADCSDVPEETGGTGGAAGGTAGAGALGGGGQPQAGTSGFARCGYSGPNAPLTRWSVVDLEWTLDDVVAPGLGFPEGMERSGARVPHFVSQLFVEQLAQVAAARAQAASIDEAGLQLCAPDTADRSSCLDGWLSRSGLRLYRRALSREQISGYVTQFVEQSKLLPPAQAARTVLLSMMLSPYFVFRIELGLASVSRLEAPAGPGFPSPQQKQTPLNAYEVAARLSHFAVRRAPDEQLLRRAADGTLLQQDTLLAELHRLQASPEGARARTLQHLEWLGLEDFGASDVDGDAQLAADMHSQTASFIATVLEKDEAPLRELLTSAHQPINRNLAQHYGIDIPAGDGYEFFDLNPSLYAGVLGQGALLSRYATPTRRGHFVADELLCEQIPPPPPNIDFLNLMYMGDTPRERIMSVTQQQPCSICHNLIDPLGFALEAFDPRGRLTGFDTSGALRTSPSGASVPVANPAELGAAIAQSHEAKLCAAQRYFEHLLDRKAELAFDAAWIDCMAAAFEDGKVDLNQLANVVIGSGAVGSMLRDPSNIVAASSAADPVLHALEETTALMPAFPDSADRSQLDEYLATLRQLPALPPFQ